MSVLAAARGVSQVMNRCEDAKVSGCLDLSNCELLYLADALYMVLREYPIQLCSLKNNKLKKFPVKLPTNFPQLSALNMEGNLIEEVPEQVGQMSKLRGINLGHNRLRAFPAAVFACQQLALLDISENLIEEIDVEDVLSRLPTLKQLNIRGNPFAEKQKLAEIVQKHSNRCKIVL